MSDLIVEKAVAEKWEVGLYYYPPDVDDVNTIISATAIVTPEGLVLDGDVRISGPQVMQMMHGGTKGVLYLIQFTVKTLNGSSYCHPVHDARIVRVI
jgi:hypothetical protein